MLSEDHSTAEVEDEIEFLLDRFESARAKSPTQ
jgi:hypothetical protein